MERVKNMVFVILVAAFVFSVIGYASLDKVLPQYIDRPAKSAVEKRNYTALKDVLKSSFMTGAAQDKFDKYMADGIPFRNEMIFGNAAMQRASIKAGAFLFGYDVYPTYFGSIYNEVTEGQFLVRNVARAPEDDMVQREAWISTLNAAAKAHPEIRFSTTFLLDTRHSDQNPTYSLIGGRLIDKDWVQSELVDKLDPALNVAIDPINKDGMISSWCFTTDLHWVMERALETYNRIGSNLGWKRYEWENPIQVVDEWYGTNARSGRDFRWSSDLWDLPYAFDNLEYHAWKDKDKKVSEKPTSEPGKRESVLASESKKMKLSDPFDYYGKYHGGFNGLIINTELKNGKTCLVIGDSNCHCLKRYIAQNYEKTYIFLPGNHAFKMSFEEMIEQYEPDDVVIALQAMKYQLFQEYSPRFINLKKSSRAHSEVELEM